MCPTPRYGRRRPSHLLFERHTIFLLQPSSIDRITFDFFIFDIVLDRLHSVTRGFLCRGLSNSSCLSWERRKVCGADVILLLGPSCRDRLSYSVADRNRNLVSEYLPSPIIITCRKLYTCYAHALLSYRWKVIPCPLYSCTCATESSCNEQGRKNDNSPSRRAAPVRRLRSFSRTSLIFATCPVRCRWERC